MANSNTARVLGSHLFEPNSVRTELPFSGEVVDFLPRLERDARASALDSAMRETRTTNGQLARMLGVSETIVRGLRNGTRPLRDDRISQFGPRLRAAFGEALRGPVQLTLF